ncbi:MAG: isochorismatase family protein [Paenibacillaceae bacterium]
MSYDFEDHCWKDVVDEDVLHIYKAYERETFVGKSPALLLIDMYNMAYEGGAKLPIDLQDEFPSSCGIYAWEAIEPTKRLLAKARSIGMPVIYLTSDQLTRARGVKVSATNRKGPTRSADAFELFHEFTPELEDLLIYKTRASAFQGTPLTSYLTKMGIDSLIVLGESTSGCVRASVVDAYSHGYHTVVVEECVYDRSPLSHKISLFDLHHKYADVMHIDEVLQHLEARQLVESR